jgi:hypothetical protein
MKNLRFDMYRYQLLPRNRCNQPDLFETLEQKNMFFQRVMLEIRDFSSERRKIIGRCIFNNESFLLFRFAVSRLQQHETEDFRDEEMDTWPDFYVAIWNDPTKQMMAVEERKQAFQQTKAAVNVIEESVNLKLAKNGLRIYFEPLFKKDEFWKIVAAYEDTIEEIEFNLITPNMANIAGTLSQAMKEFARDTNTSRTKIEIASDPDASLRISKDDARVEGLVQYASEGGGRITVKVKDLRCRLSTSDSIKTMEIRDADISGKTPEDIAAVLRSIML